MASFVVVRGNIFAVAHSPFFPHCPQTSAQHSLLVLHQRKHGPCVLPFQNMFVALATIVGSVLFAVSSFFIKFNLPVSIFLLLIWHRFLGLFG